MTRIALLALTALLMASCGRQGDLARPGPLFGGARDAAQDAPLQDRDGDAVEGTQGDQRSIQMDSSRTLETPANRPVEGASDPVGGRPSTTPGGTSRPGA